MACINFPKIVADKMLEHAEENDYQVDVEDLYAHCYDEVFRGEDIRFQYPHNHMANAPEIIAAFEEIERIQNNLDGCEIVDPREDSK